MESSAKWKCKVPLQLIKIIGKKKEKKKMQGFLLKTEDFPAVRAEYEAKCQNLLREGQSLGYCVGCVPMKSFTQQLSSDYFSQQPQTSVLGGGAPRKQQQRPRGTCWTFPSWAPGCVLTSLPGDSVSHSCLRTTASWWILVLKMMEKDKCCMVSLTCGLQRKQQTSEYSKKETDSQVERTN